MNAAEVRDCTDDCLGFRVEHVDAVAVGDEKAMMRGIEGQDVPTGRAGQMQGVGRGVVRLGVFGMR